MEKMQGGFIMEDSPELRAFIASIFAYVAESCSKKTAALRNMGTEMGSAISRGFMRMASV